MVSMCELHRCFIDIRSSSKLTDIKGFCSTIGINNLFESENYESDIFDVAMREYCNKEKKQAEALNFLLYFQIRPTQRVEQVLDCLVQD